MNIILFKINHQKKNSLPLAKRDSKSEYFEDTILLLYFPNDKNEKYGSWNKIEHGRK